MMTRPLLATSLCAAFAAWVTLAGVPQVAAQYMFLDSNGDGVYTSDDSNGWSSPAIVDLYLVTDRNFDGSPVQCPEGTPLDVYSYMVNLIAYGQAVTFTDITNNLAGATPMFPIVTYPHALSIGYAGFGPVPPGKHKLLSMTVTTERGCPALAIVPTSCYSPPGVVTSFGSSCPGQQSDNTLRMGEDWFEGPWTGACIHFVGALPTLTCGSDVLGVAGQPLTVTVRIDAPTCSFPQIGFSNLPPGMTIGGGTPFVAGVATQSLNWTPSTSQIGEYSVGFETRVYDPYAGVDYHSSCSTRIVVRAANSAPLADAGGPYSGGQGEPVSFDGSQSRDPEGDALEYFWDFGDGVSGTGAMPAHVYSAGGAYTVVLTVRDPGTLSDQDSTAAMIAKVWPARVFTTPSSRVTRIPQGRPTTCFEIEPPVGSSFTPAEIVPSSVVLRYTGAPCGELEVRSSADKSPGTRDADRNGLVEYEACFTREAMAMFASCLAPGRNSLLLRISGALSNGNRFEGEVVHEFVSGGGMQVAVSPNPLSASSTLDFTTTASGSVSAALFDIQGRRVAAFVDEPALAAGNHRIPLTAYERLRPRLASGVYFLSVTAQHDGSSIRRVTVLR